jgi:hypothetical protein
MQKNTKNEGHSVLEFSVLKRNTGHISEIKAKYIWNICGKQKRGVRDEVIEEIIPWWISAGHLHRLTILIRPHIYYKTQ